ncbi:unnamed protein product [Trifolium pratense]|uniref:Uncharacterized protein n=1 Tax=Trifolium pratense TaxID=57577 RepID=A0ACB0JZS0_TRIPR|nr:unnamed protein product [Trifolium pratense]
MRSGGCALQQTLTAEAASVLKHSLVLARRRGHPQVTPLHVAITLLTLRLSSFKRACLKSHQPHHQTSQHPLQSRALELCFNVALNRLPTTPSPLIHSQPSLSNALIAALKRAQAHQRRGSIEQQQQQQQQQTVLTVKVELEQLIISILDDPSVSRVMREAGFSSTLVKNNLEDSCSPSNSVFKCYNSSGGGVFSSPCSPSTSENHRETINLSSFRQNHFMAATSAKFNSSEFNSVLFSAPKRTELMNTSSALGLTLHSSSSVLDSKMTISQNLSHHMMETKPFSSNKEQEDKLICCEECASNYEKEAQFLKPEQNKTLPFWLQSHGTEEQKKDGLTELKRKWNRLCHCLHQNKQHQNHWNWSNNNSSNPNNSSTSISYTSNLTPRFRRQQSCSTIEFNFNDNRQATKPVFDSLVSMEGKEVKISLTLGNGDSSEKVGNITDTKLQQAHVCKLLQENVPWQSETITSIAKALTDTKSTKQSETIFTWFLLQGNDFIGKRRLTLAIAESVFGSADLVLQLDMLKKETSIAPFSEMLLGALRTHQQLVVLIENVDFADTQFMKFLSDGYEKGKFETLSSKEGNLGQVIFILTKGGSTSIEEKNKKPVINLLWQISEIKPNFLSPKRKAELDLFSKIKNPRIEENEKGLLISEQGSKKTEFLRQSSFNSNTNTLDLNMKADEEEENGEGKEKRESSSFSSDLTREAIVNPLNSNGFLDSIENKFEFNTNSDKDREKTEIFLFKIKGSFEDVCGKQKVVNLSVDEKVIKEMCLGCCCFFTNKMFEKWLKDIFQSSLETVNFGGKEGIHFRLCLGDRNWDSGFMGSSLPKSIQVNYLVE